MLTPRIKPHHDNLSTTRIGEDVLSLFLVRADATSAPLPEEAIIDDNRRYFGQEGLVLFQYAQPTSSMAEAARMAKASVRVFGRIAARRCFRGEADG